MWRTNLRIVLVVLVTLAVYTGISNVIPQVQSEVPQRVEIGSDVSTEQLVSMGEELFHGAGGCEACHGLGTRAPTLMGEIGARCGDRVEGMSCKAYLHESLVDPGAHVVEGFQPIMPNVGAQLSGGQVWALVAFLESQGGEVTVTAQDLEGAAAGGAGGEDAGATGAGPGGEAGAGGAEQGGDGAVALLRQHGCVACHQIGGEGGAVAPPVEAIQAADLSRDYLRRSIVDPAADTASGYEQDYSAFVGTMPPNFGDLLSEDELQTLVAFLAGEGGS